MLLSLNLWLQGFRRAFELGTYESRSKLRQPGLGKDHKEGSTNYTRGLDNCPCLSPFLCARNSDNLNLEEFLAIAGNLKTFIQCV